MIVPLRGKSLRPAKSGCVAPAAGESAGSRNAQLDPAALGLPALRRRVRAGRRLALARACAAAPGLVVHDAMAGWGTDGLVLAGLGCVVHMSERVAAVHDVLRARVAEAVAVGKRFGAVTTACEDARVRWGRGSGFDVVYLDPMFGPHRTSAAPAKRMGTLRALAGETPDVELAALVLTARGVASSRVVVKRRAKAPRLRGVGEPDWIVRGRSVCFEVYLARGAARGAEASIA